MKKQLLCFFSFLSLCLIAHSQIIFEAGYFIDNEGNRIECLIKNKQWRSNPTDFKYKIGENGTEKIGTIDKVQEFGINNYSRFVRAKVKIDRSTDQTAKLDFDKEPKWSTEIVYLNTIVLGKAYLYKYVEGADLIRYFYQIGDSEIKQLIYKRYIVHAKAAYGTPQDISGKGNKYKAIKENQEYKKQLWEDVRCSSQDMKRIKSLRFNQSNLVKYFKAYNKCMKN